MALTDKESRAILDLVVGYEQTAFDALLERAGGFRLASFSSTSKPMPEVATDFLRWLKSNPAHASKILPHLIEQGSAHPSAAILSDMISSGINSGSSRKWDRAIGITFGCDI